MTDTGRKPATEGRNALEALCRVDYVAQQCWLESLSKNTILRLCAVSKSLQRISEPKLKGAIWCDDANVPGGDWIKQLDCFFASIARRPACVKVEMQFYLLGTSDIHTLALPFVSAANSGCLPQVQQLTLRLSTHPHARRPRLAVGRPDVTILGDLAQSLASLFPNLDTLSITGSWARDTLPKQSEADAHANANAHAHTLFDELRHLPRLTSLTIPMQLYQVQKPQHMLSVQNLALELSREAVNLGPPDLSVPMAELRTMVLVGGLSTHSIFPPNLAAVVHRSRTRGLCPHLHSLALEKHSVMLPKAEAPAGFWRTVVVPAAAYTSAGHKLSITAKAMEAQDVASLLAFAQRPPATGLQPLQALHARIDSVLREEGPWTWEAAWAEQSVWQVLAMEPGPGPHNSISAGEVHVGPVAAPLAMMAVQTGVLGAVGTLVVHWSDWERGWGPEEGEPGVEGEMDEYAMALGQAVAAMEVVEGEPEQGQQGQAQGQPALAVVEGQPQGQQAMVGQPMQGQGQGPEQGQGQGQQGPGQGQGQQGQVPQGQFVRRLPRRLRLVVGGKGKRPACPDLEVLRALAGEACEVEVVGRDGKPVTWIEEGAAAGLEVGQQEGDRMVVVAEGGEERPQELQAAADEGPQEMEVE